MFGGEGDRHQCKSGLWRLTNHSSVQLPLPETAWLASPVVRETQGSRVGDQHLNLGFFTVTFNVANLVPSFLPEVIRYM